MQVGQTKLLRTGAVALATIGVLAGASSAAASAVREGTKTVYPTATSPLTASGSTLSAGPDAGTSGYIRMLGSFRDSLTCTSGSLSGKLGTNPSTSLALTPLALQISSCTSPNNNHKLTISLQKPGVVTSDGAIKGATFAVEGNLAGFLMPYRCIIAPKRDLFYPVFGGQRAFVLINAWDMVEVGGPTKCGDQMTKSEIDFRYGNVINASSGNLVGRFGS